MRIVVALHDYLPLHKGGSEVHAHQTAAELARRGHDVTALFTERDLAAPEGEVRRGELDGVKTVEVVHQREYADVAETWREERALGWFRERLAELEPQVVHFHHLALWGAAAVGAAREAGARVVVTLHDYWLLCDAATLLRTDGELCLGAERGACTDCIRRHPLLPDRWEGSESEERLWERVVAERLAHHRGALAQAHRILSPSHFLARTFAEAKFLRAADVEVRDNGCPGVLHEPRTSARTPLRVGYVGGIYPSKGVHVLVRAFRHLDGEAELDVHGHLDWFPEYAAELAGLAQGSPVRFRGPFDPPDVDRVLAELDVLVVPSVWVENMPLTIQEAFRNGLPVITTDLGGMAEAVQHEVNGLTFPRGDDLALAEAIRRLAREPGLYARLAAGRSRVRRIEEVVDDLERIYAGRGPG